MPKQSTRGNFVQALIAVLAGNGAYYLLTPYLPVGARHRALHYDMGLVVDFWFCLVAFGLVKNDSGLAPAPPDYLQERVSSRKL